MKTIILMLIYFSVIWNILVPRGNNLFLRKIIWLLLFLFLGYTIQSGELEENSDLSNYSMLFSAEEFLWTPQFIREFLFWFLGRFIFSKVNNLDATFFLMNVILAFILLKAFKNITKLEKQNNIYLLFGFLLFYPFLSGIHLVYRQLFSMILLFYATSNFKNKSYVIGVLSYIFSIFFHNIAILYFPLMFLSFQYKFTRYLLVLSYIIILFLLKFFDSSDVEYLVRHDFNYKPYLTYMYFAVFSILIFFIRIISRYNVVKNDYNLKVILLLSSIFMISFIALENNLNIERIGMFGMGIIYFYLGLALNKLSSSRVVKLIYFHLALVPIITFYTAYLY